MQQEQPTHTELEVADKSKDSALVSEEEYRKKHETVQRHINLVKKRMLDNEEIVLSNHQLTAVKIRELYLEAERDTKILNWLQSIEYNRFVYPVEKMKAEAEYEKAKNEQKQQSEGRILTSV